MALVAKGMLGYPWSSIAGSAAIWRRLGQQCPPFVATARHNIPTGRCRRRDFGVQGCGNDVRSVVVVGCRVGAARDCRTYLARGGCRRCRMRRCRCQREEDPLSGGGCLAWRRLSHSWRAHALTIGALATVHEGGAFGGLHGWPA